MRFCPFFRIVLYNTGMNLEEFEALVTRALESLPAEFAKKLDNVEVVVEAWPSVLQLRQSRVGSGMTLYGLYQGVPRTKRGQYFGVLPDKITIFAGPILSSFGFDQDTVKDQVRRTVIHEIGHHFGMSEEDIQRAQKGV